MWEHNPKLDIDSGAIIITRPNALTAKIHDRMPGHGRYVTFQMAEVAIRRDLFANQQATVP